MVPKPGAENGSCKTIDCVLGKVIDSARGTPVSSQHTHLANHTMPLRLDAAGE